MYAVVQVARVTVTQWVVCMCFVYDLVTCNLFPCVSMQCIVTLTRRPWSTFGRQTGVGLRANKAHGAF